jgi:hypothetical protein
MKRAIGLPTAAVVLLLTSVAGAGEMKATLKVDGSNPQVLQIRFSNYGYRARPAVFPEQDGVRFWLPAGVAGVPQTGLYSYFALAGDCEVTLTYELLNLPRPRSGYGSGVGLAFDGGDGVGRGSIQRVVRTSGESGYVLQSSVAGSLGKPSEEERFVPATAKRGQIGLRRIKKELIFLVSDSPTGPPEEVDRLPFTDQTIRVVRVFADPGGSPTAVDVRVRQMEVRAEEITGGIPERDQQTSRWWWLLALVPTAGVPLVWFWRARRRDVG